MTQKCIILQFRSAPSRGEAFIFSRIQVPGDVKCAPICTSSQLEQMSPYIRLKILLMEKKEKYIFLVVVTGLVINDRKMSSARPLT